MQEQSIDKYFKSIYIDRLESEWQQLDTKFTPTSDLRHEPRRQLLSGSLLFVLPPLSVSLCLYPSVSVLPSLCLRLLSLDLCLFLCLPLLLCFSGALFVSLASVSLLRACERARACVCARIKRTHTQNTHIYTLFLTHIHTHTHIHTYTHARVCT